MNIVGYCRVSTDTTDQLNSLEAQKQFFDEYAQKNGHALVKIYADEGISGTKTKNRKEFLRLMKDANTGIFDMVVVKDISRFARNTVDLLNNTRQLKALNIETLFLTANMTVLGNSEFVLTIFGALAQEESANTSKRVKFGKQRNAEKGRVPNLVFGYDKTKGDFFNLTINKNEAIVVQRIFTMYVNEGYGAAKISQVLNSEGIRTKRGAAWSQNAIARILKNELYIGKVINGKEEITDFLTGVRRDKDESEWKIVDRPDLAIISLELHAQAQETLFGRHTAFKITGERHNNKHLFSTLIKCADCGYSFRRIVMKYKNTYTRWVCSGRNAKGTGSCGNRTSIDEGELIEVLRKYFTNILLRKPSIIKHIVKEFTGIYKAQDTNEQRADELQAKLAKIRHKRESHMDMYSDGVITRDEMREKMNTANAAIEKLENELKLISYNLSKSGQLENILSKTFTTVEDIVSLETMTNAQLKQVIQKIMIAPGREKDGEEAESTVDIYLRLFGDIGLDETFLVSPVHT
ncbi:MAG: recombinase family protein [Defluviitaleaceae bacterium]|nr:recombinase family protein [Defluviitaleaceae bacterium]